MIEDLRRRLVGERRALALLALGFLTTLFVLVALAQGGAWAACFAALAVTYGVAFFGIASEWFWARWFTMGIASSGDYGIPKDVMYGFPVTTAAGRYELVRDLPVDDFSRERMNATLKELEEERAGVASLLG